MKKLIFILSIFFIISFAYAQDENDNLIEVPQPDAISDDCGKGSDSLEDCNEPVDFIQVPPNTEEPILNKSEEKKEKKKKRKKQKGKKRTKFAMGMNISAMASNSYLKLSDFFQESLEIDLNEMNPKLPKSGYNVSALANVDLFLEIYLQQKYEFGFFLDVDTQALVNIPKSVINLIAEGNSVNTNIQDKIQSTAFAFAEQSSFFGMKIKDLTFRINASWFFPVAYLDKEMGDYTLITDADGKIHAKGDLDVKLYSVIPNSVFGGPNNNFNTRELFKSSGFDLDFIGSYNLPPYAKVNFAVFNIPIVPARLSTGVQIKYSGEFKLESLMKYFLGEEDPGDTSSFTKTDPVYDLPQKKIIRPH